MRAEPWTEPLCFHGEGPVWDERTGVLRWVDMLSGDVLARAGDGGPVERTHVSEVAAALRPRAGGGLVLGIERGFALQEPDGGVHRLPELWADTGVRMNEGSCDPAGNFSCGSMAVDEAPGRGRLFRLTPGLDVSIVLEGVSVSNGLAWHPDGGSAFYVDSPTREIAAFDVADDGSFTGRRTVAVIDGDQGVPDGLTIDADGRLWVAVNGAGAVHCYDQGGSHVDTVEVDAAEVTSCTFGGADLDRLFITTSRQGVEPSGDPLAGAVFVAAPGVRGLPVLPFGG